MKRVLIACLALLMATLACSLPTTNTLSCTSYTVTVDFEILVEALNNEEADDLEIIEILFGVEIEDFEDLEDFIFSNATPTNLPSGAYIEAIDGNGNLLILEEIDPNKLQQVGEFIGVYTIFFQQSPQANPITVNIFGVESGLKFTLHTYVGNVNCNVHDDYQKIGQIKVTAPGTALYEAPGGSVVRNDNAEEIWIPNQTAHDPYQDVYDVLNQTDVDGVQWVEIFVGNAAGTVWVPVGGPVQILSLN